MSTVLNAVFYRIINPAKAKEDLLFQLQSQISDLERFIEFIMVEGTVAPVGNQALCACNKKCPVHAGPMASCEDHCNKDEVIRDAKRRFFARSKFDHHYSFFPSCSLRR